MLGYEPPQPKLWKALVGAGIIVFPILYVFDVALLHHQPGWLYLAISCAVTFLLGYQMYSGGPESLRPIRFFRGARAGITDEARSLIPKDDSKQNARQD